MDPGKTFLWVFLSAASTISQNYGHCALSTAYKYLVPRLLIHPEIAVELFFLGSPFFFVVVVVFVFFFHPETLKFRKD